LLVDGGRCRWVRYSCYLSSDARSSTILQEALVILKPVVRHMEVCVCVLEAGTATGRQRFEWAKWEVSGERVDVSLA
jgi:hypothetical protein